MKKSNFQTRGKSVIGISIGVVATVIIGGSFYYYFQTPVVKNPAIRSIQETSKQQESTFLLEDELLVSEKENLGTKKPNTQETIPQSEQSFTKPNPVKPIARKCSDGTPYGECSINKPKYCEKGNLINKVSLCGCPTNYESDANQCRKKLAQNCQVIHEGVKDRSKGINFLIVPADSLYGTFLNNPNAQYSGNLDTFIIDAKKNVNDFLSVEPMNQYKNIFNFYTSSTVVPCTTSNGYVVCDSWKEAANSCNISYDKVIVLQRKEGGGICCNPIQSSALSTITFVHEISHILGFVDYDIKSMYAAPNRCTKENLNECGKTICQFDNRWTQKPIEFGGPECALHVATWGEVDYYIPNEQSVMNYGIDYKALRFTHLERPYLEKLFAKIVSMGKDSVLCGSGEHSIFTFAEYCHRF